MKKFIFQYRSLETQEEIRRFAYEDKVSESKIVNMALDNFVAKRQKKEVRKADKQPR
jgi:hypothetical protein